MSTPSAFVPFTQRLTKTIGETKKITVLWLIVVTLYGSYQYNNKKIQTKYLLGYQLAEQI